MVLPGLTLGTNCGQNSYALSACRYYVLSANLAADENNGLFEIGKVDTNCIPMLFRDIWGVSGKDFLVRTNFLSGSATKHQAVIVCTRQFDNVPQPVIWNLYHKNPAHAVGYSDGTAGLILPVEFSNLNLSGFISVASLATNSEFNILKN